MFGQMQYRYGEIKTISCWNLKIPLRSSVYLFLDFTINAPILTRGDYRLGNLWLRLSNSYDRYDCPVSEISVVDSRSQLMYYMLTYHISKWRMLKESTKHKKRKT